MKDVFLDILSLIVKIVFFVVKIAIFILIAIFIVPISAAFLLVVPTSLMLLEDKDRN